nr:hypothetical protein [Candidatus Sigynarchaeum springense]
MANYICRKCGAEFVQVSPRDIGGATLMHCNSVMIMVENHDAEPAHEHCRVCGKYLAEGTAFGGPNPAPWFCKQHKPE